MMELRVCQQLLLLACVCLPLALVSSKRKCYHQCHIPSWELHLNTKFEQRSNTQLRALQRLTTCCGGCTCLQSSCGWKWLNLIFFLGHMSRWEISEGRVLWFWQEFVVRRFVWIHASSMNDSLKMVFINHQTGMVRQDTLSWLLHFLFEIKTKTPFDLPNSSILF